MEKRIFKFGKTSFAIILPKKWVDKSSLDTSGTIFLSENDRGDLIISPRERSKKEFEIKINSRFNPKLIGRWVGKLYTYGLSKIKISSDDHFTDTQLKEIEDEIKNECPGFEVTHQTNNEIFIEDFTDLNQISIDKIISRLRYLIKQQFEEAKKQNTKTVSKIEKLVDRFNMLGIRYLNIVEPKDALKYFRILSFLEYISDYTLLIVDNFEVNVEIFNEISKAFDLCFFDKLEKIQNTAEIREKIYKMVKKFKIKKLPAYLFKKIADYISQIAEFGLKKESSIRKMKGWTKIEKKNL